MTRSQGLKREFSLPLKGEYSPEYFQYLGYQEDLVAPNVTARANATASLFSRPPAYIYENDLIVGSIRPLWCEKSEDVLSAAKDLCESFGQRDFLTNADHFSPDYRRIVSEGIPGLLQEISNARNIHTDSEKLRYLAAMEKTVEGFRQMVLNYAHRAEELQKAASSPQVAENMQFIKENCLSITSRKPTCFAEGLQLVWLCHIAFCYEKRAAMALGRMDQYLYPLYLQDRESGLLTRARAIELLECVFMKIYEKHVFRNDDDVVNICIGGIDPEGVWQGNELSFCILEAVGNCNVPGPNLSARISSATPDDFLDACLKVIGTGLGYPALMNDEVNIPALLRMGYDEKAVYDYSFVGCIENFMTGLQPPWSDGRFDTPRFFEYLFHGGRGILSPTLGLDTGPLEEISTMEEFLHRFELQLAKGAEEYYVRFRNRNDRLRRENYADPFLSCFCRDCIGRGLDIHQGGSVYPSAHGVALMGVGTVADSLAAVEEVVFRNKEATLTELGSAMESNFQGYETLREKLLAAPKYGNNDDRADRYAVWFVDYLTALFDRYRTPDGGRIYTAMAANISNVSAGEKISATPDGRLAGEPLSDAASPTYGRDRRGATVTLQSLTKPDYTKIACGTVVNQKFSPSMFSDGKRQKLLTLVKTYFRLGGQEIQINATSREILLDAMEHPRQYPDLVVRVSGFSAQYVTLSRGVQWDILNRTQQE